MHAIEPFYNWEPFYVPAEDEYSPFYGAFYDINRFRNDIYGYYIHPMWDFFGSETLYMKVLFADYNREAAIIELMGEWNDCLHNDIMHLKRNIIDHMIRKGIRHFLLIGENVLNFHGADDEYYAEWFDDIEDGWIVGINFREHITEQWQLYDIDQYLHYGGMLEIDNWRTFKPGLLLDIVNKLVTRRLTSSDC